MPPARFWVANAVQAALFGLLHGHLVQMSYAFAIGLVLGMVFWRTGRLRYNILLHAAVNLASFAVDPLWTVLTAFGAFGAIAVLIALCAGGASLFRAGTEPLAGMLPPAGTTGTPGATDEGPSASTGVAPDTGTNVPGDTLP